MFSDEFLEKCFTNEDMRKIPCGSQSTAIHAIEDILTELVKENPYVSVSELLTTDE